MAYLKGLNKTVDSGFDRLTVKKGVITKTETIGFHCTMTVGSEDEMNPQFSNRFGFHYMDFGSLTPNSFEYLNEDDIIELININRIETNGGRIEIEFSENIFPIEIDELSYGDLIINGVRHKLYPSNIDTIRTGMNSDFENYDTNPFGDIGDIVDIKIEYKAVTSNGVNLI